MTRRPAAGLATTVVLAVVALPSLRAEAELPASSTRKVEVMGTPVRVLTLGLEERGEGQPVLFLHGGAGSSLETWGDWLSSIALLAPVVAYDRPGLGRSPFDGKIPTPGRVVAHAHELL
ncbi:MAG: hypothetical protein MI919_41140, partial [Holophagales bacterium]|nr:hypothetical protein [Holophagales bacterium]